MVVSSVVPIGRDKSISHVFASQLAAAAVAMFGQPPVVPGIEQPAQVPDVTIREIKVIKAQRSMVDTRPGDIKFGQFA